MVRVCGCGEQGVQRPPCGARSAGVPRVARKACRSAPAVLALEWVQGHALAVQAAAEVTAATAAAVLSAAAAVRAAVALRAAAAVTAVAVVAAAEAATGGPPSGELWSRQGCRDVGKGLWRTQREGGRAQLLHCSRALLPRLLRPWQPHGPPRQWQQLALCQWQRPWRRGAGGMAEQVRAQATPAAGTRR